MWRTVSFHQPIISEVIKTVDSLARAPQLLLELGWGWGGEQIAMLFCKMSPLWSVRLSGPCISLSFWEPHP